MFEHWRAAETLTEAYRRNGTQSFTGLREHDLERLERSHKSLCCGGWIFYNLADLLPSTNPTWRPYSSMCG